VEAVSKFCDHVSISEEVLFSEYAGSPVLYKGEEYLILCEKDIWCVREK
jgi:co-chaperonin GroES (HSP10)